MTGFEPDLRSLGADPIRPWLEHDIADVRYLTAVPLLYGPHLLCMHAATWRFWEMFIPQPPIETDDHWRTSIFHDRLILPRIICEATRPRLPWESSTEWDFRCVKRQFRVLADGNVEEVENDWAV